MTAGDRPTVAEIAALVRRIRAVTDPAERQAVIAEKREILRRIEEADQ